MFRFLTADLAVLSYPSNFGPIVYYFGTVEILTPDRIFCKGASFLSMKRSGHCIQNKGLREILAGMGSKGDIECVFSVDRATVKIMRVVIYRFRFRDAIGPRFYLAIKNRSIFFNIGTYMSTASMTFLSTFENG